MDQKRKEDQKNSNVATKTTLIVKAVFKLDNRITEDLLKSLFDILKLNLSIQDHTTIS
ncbi:MAG: transposase, partial [Brevinematia bacterium]